MGIKENNLQSSDIIYITFNDSKTNDYAENDTDSLTEQRKSIAVEVKDEMDKLTGVTAKDTLTVYRVRFGPSTTSVEVGISITGGETLTESDIKRNLVQVIVDGTIREKIFVAQLDIIKDIYFDGISKYPELQSSTAQYKRVMLEIPGVYPITESDRVKFEESMINSIRDILETDDLELDRIHLERIARVKNNTERVIIQFLIMDGLEGTKKSNEIIMEFKNKYKIGENDYSKIHNITNVVFGDPSIILDGSELDIPNTLTEEKELVEDVDKATLNKLEGEYKRVSYYGCELALDDLKNNLITASTPLSLQCEPNIHQYLNGYMSV